jgi:hypothetical protein
MTEIMKLRNRIARDTGLDFFAHAKALSRAWRAKADRLD